jgi:hypothetical protein
MVDDASKLRSLAGAAQIEATGITHRSLGDQSRNRLKSPLNLPAIRSHSRLMAGSFMAQQMAARFSQAVGESHHEKDARPCYLQALRSADEGDDTASMRSAQSLFFGDY